MPVRAGNHAQAVRTGYNNNNEHLLMVFIYFITHLVVGTRVPTTSVRLPYAGGGGYQVPYYGTWYQISRTDGAPICTAFEI